MNIGVSTSLGTSRKKDKSRVLRYFKQIELQTMIWPGLICMILFSYLPLYGILIAFKEYNIGVNTGITGIFKADWAGFKYFEQFLSHPDFWLALKNTLGINFLNLFIGFPMPIIFAIILNEITCNRFKKITQTISYLPHFVSWVIYGGIIINLLSIETGVVNYILTNLGIVKEPILFLGEPKYFWTIAIITAITKELGWSAIIYLAAISGVDIQLYEAANIDGANRFQKIWNITLPSISGTIIILLIFSISNILNSGFDQIWILQNGLNVSMSETIDTYVYKVGLGQMRFAYSTAVGLVRSVVAVMLLCSANFISKRVSNKGLF